MLVLVFLLLGCTKENDGDWNLSPTFDVDNLTLHGTEGKFGIIKVNGESNEPEFPVTQGRLYEVYFLDSSEELNGKKYKMMATHQETGETVKLHEKNIEKEQNAAKFGFDKLGLWKIDITIDEKNYTSFVVEAK
ncbi:hypothetical protein [Psychrobacillus vulpis]|uniref:DUF4871 domain-containing protein n=1 Tax=Psychrobacillus vulpis TaxID=2325572 RepID=A0A544TDI4_9BACI|nr:hypothetical protein [Psychrobacillus vulpis]TQR15505.1 hypothetical protein FG384_19285 [Psychrobacillus vulpis]